jgi:predicted HicB family RNase H-like nuclease
MLLGKGYKGYIAIVELDEEDELLHGEVIGIDDVITFEAATVPELRRAFVSSVNDYLAFCKERGEEPNKPYSGKILLRMEPEVHRKAEICAREAGLSLNKWMSSCIEKATNVSETNTLSE